MTNEQKQNQNNVITVYTETIQLDGGKEREMLLFLDEAGVYDLEFNCEAGKLTAADIESYFFSLYDGNPALIPTAIKVNYLENPYFVKLIEYCQKNAIEVIPALPHVVYMNNKQCKTVEDYKNEIMARSNAGHEEAARAA